MYDLEVNRSVAKRDRKAGNGSSNGQNATTGNGGEGGAGRLSQFKNHSKDGKGASDDFISGTDKYRG
ncbi:hypothetical protein [Paenibacillus lutimineralis]|uniref:Uncharacterized protein n=1 Tax=Paenibacillus lutimineralis TaxID=2707005 RepID=A0A3Q9IF96_9BACL|nr:hypothetical protein [Paenibacillus lutimineralis]AZS17729.1 hypothetical protein EI981_27060 [Paenibacillus lutimineralis]